MTEENSQERQHAPSAPSDAPTVPETSYAERARTLVSLERVGSLSSHSRRLPGFPFGSVMPYGLDEMGCPTMLISTMAMHTQNLNEDSRASLLVAEPGEDPLGSGRVTLVGKAERVDEVAAVRERYLTWHENAKYWVDFKDFAFYRLDIAEVYFVGGFGVMGWVSASDYMEAQPDPLAPSASGILDHMNADHEEAMLLLARGLAALDGTAAKMTAIDRLGFHLRVETADGMKGVRLGFPRSLETAKDVRAELVRMVAEHK